MSKKPKALFLWDIDPNKWYLRVRPDRACVGDLVKIYCDSSTTGWQRGHVIMTVPTWDKAFAHGTTIYGQLATFEVRKHPQDYRYAFSPGGYPNLFEVPDNWIDTKISDSQYRASVAQAEYNKLKGIVDANALR